MAANRRLMGKVVCMSSREDQVREVELVEEGETIVSYHTLFEESLDESGGIGSKKKKTKPCPINSCDVRVPHLKRHVCKYHLPWYIAAHTACWSCHQQEASPCLTVALHTKTHEKGAAFSDANAIRWCYLVNGMLHFIREELQLESLDAVLSFVVENNIYPPFDPSGQDFNDQETYLMRLYCERMKITCPSKFNVHPPKCTIEMIHWRILSGLLNKLSQEQQAEVLSLEVPMTIGGLLKESCHDQPMPDIHLFDSHFHLDMLLKRSHARTLSEVEEEVSRPFVLAGGVANFVYPEHWKDCDDQLDDRLFVSFGIHPHFVDSGSSEKLPYLKTLLQSKRCVALGEIGIDVTGGNQNKSYQVEFLRQVLPFAKELSLPIILHCRDSGIGEADSILFEILTQLNFDDHNIHYHCYTGTAENAQKWLCKFKNISFGITSYLLRDNTLVDVIGRTNINHLLVESDAPYLSPEKYVRVNSPWSVLKIVQRISEIKNIPVTILSCILNENVKRTYQL